ncbi:MAG: DUF1810 domain-containing protein [Prochlorothrix sp.]|nr:DUF1810 domain-containing protein [Prochlorothrix sp.]
MSRLSSADPFDLARFVTAQQTSFDRALAEVKSGYKSSHWMWYIFPQLRGLGRSTISQRYGISGTEEAHAYLTHEVLGPRLLTISEALLSVKGRSAIEIFGEPDHMKLRSCATLFAHTALLPTTAHRTGVTPPATGQLPITDPSPKSCPPGTDSVFQQIIDRYFDGQIDRRTIQRLNDRP